MSGNARRNHRRCSVRRGVLRNFAKFVRDVLHSVWFLIKSQSVQKLLKGVEAFLPRGRVSVNFGHLNVHKIWNPSIYNMTIFGNFDFPPYGSPLPKDLYCPVGLCTVLFGLSPLLFLIALAWGAFLPTFVFFSQFSSFLQYSVLVSCTNDMVAWHLFWAIIFSKKWILLVWRGSEYDCTCDPMSMMLR